LISIFQYLKVRVCGCAPELDTICPNSFSIVLYSILFSNDSYEFLSSNQYILLTLSPKCLCLMHIYFFQLSCLSSICRHIWRFWFVEPGFHSDSRSGYSTCGECDINWLYDFLWLWSMTLTLIRQSFKWSLNFEFWVLSMSFIWSLNYFVDIWTLC